MMVFMLFVIWALGFLVLFADPKKNLDSLGQRHCLYRWGRISCRGN